MEIIDGPLGSGSLTPVETLSRDWSEYRANWARAERRQTLTDFPLHLDLELAGNCNLKCDMCWQSGALTAPLGLMKDKTFRNIIDSAVPLGLAAIKLQSRGESTLHPRLAELAKYAKDAGVMDVQLTTNGTLFEKQGRLEALLMSGIDKLIFSIDRDHDDSAREIYGDRAPDVREVFRRTLRLRRALGLTKPALRVQTFALPGQTQQERLTEVRSEFPDADEYLVNVLWNSTTDADSISDLSEEFDLLPCGYLWTRMVVYWNGDVTLCCRDYNGELNLGNVADTSIKDIWNGPRMQELRRMHLDGRRHEISVCGHCDAYSCRKNEVPSDSKLNTFIHVASGQTEMATSRDSGKGDQQ